MPSRNIETSELIGVWSTSAHSSSGTDADEILVFQSNSHGWFEVWSFGLCSVDYFEWQHTSTGWVVLAGTKSFELDTKTMKLVPSSETMGIEHTSYQVQEEETPSGRKMKVLRIEVGGFGDFAFGLLEPDADSRTRPI